MCFRDMEERKSHVIIALVKLGCAQADSILNPEEAQEEHADSLCTAEDVDKTFSEIQKWADATDSKVSVATQQ